MPREVTTGRHRASSPRGQRGRTLLGKLVTRTAAVLIADEIHGLIDQHDSWLERLFELLS